MNVWGVRREVCVMKRRYKNYVKMNVYIYTQYRNRNKKIKHSAHSARGRYNSDDTAEIFCDICIT